MYINHDNLTFSDSSLISSSVTDSTSSSSITLNRPCTSFFVVSPLDDFLLGLAFAKIHHKKLIISGYNTLQKILNCG